jgi:hypothetical protein
MNAQNLTLEQLAALLWESHALTNSWRKTGAPYGLSGAMARLIALGYEPGRKVRAALGLRPVITVIQMGAEIPDGAQVISASLCSCGRWFIGNHPRRTKCFICSPFRPGKKKEGLA